MYKADISGIDKNIDENMLCFLVKLNHSVYFLMMRFDSNEILLMKY